MLRKFLTKTKNYTSCCRISETAFQVVVLLCVVVGFLVAGRTGATTTAPQRLVAVWNSPTGSKDLKSWDVAELGKSFKTISTREKDPSDGTIVRWVGVSLQEIIDKALGSLSPELKAQVDLVILKGADKEALIPRSLITKYPLLVATRRNQSDIGGFQTVVPWTSKTRILEESLPLERYFVPQLSKIELANYRARYGSLFLKRRTDPSAMRGEKLYVQNCIACHPAAQGSGQGLGPMNFTSEAKVRTLASTGHPVVKGMPKLSDRDQRALMSYLSAYRNENPTAVSASGGGQVSSR